MAEKNFFTDIALAVADAMSDAMPEIKKVVNSDVPFMQKPTPRVNWKAPQEKVDAATRPQ